MRELAQYILFRANRINRPITNLQLQKIMYFALGFMIEENRELAQELFNQEPMEAWIYGPVVPDIYNEYKIYKSRPIEDLGQSSNRLDNDYINNIIDRLIQVDPFKLVEISHRHRFWKENSQDIKYSNIRPTYQFRNIEESFNG